MFDNYKRIKISTRTLIDRIKMKRHHPPRHPLRDLMETKTETSDILGRYDKSTYACSKISGKVRLPGTFSAVREELK